MELTAHCPDCKRLVVADRLHACMAIVCPHCGCEICWIGPSISASKQIVEELTQLTNAVTKANKELDECK